MNDKCKVCGSFLLFSARQIGLGLCRPCRRNRLDHLWGEFCDEEGAIALDQLHELATLQGDEIKRMRIGIQHSGPPPISHPVTPSPRHPINTREDDP